jgi:SOUL heme-binding protein
MSSVPMILVPLGILMALFPAASHAAADKSKSLPSDKYEQPRYTVVERADDIEIRRYESMLMAEVDVDGDRGTAANRGFRILAGYIFGKNVKRENIAMTSPVTQSAANTAEPGNQVIAMTSPVTQVPLDAQNTADPTRWVVGFMMPSEFTLDTLPKAKDERIRFRTTEPVTRVSIRFSGFSTQANLGEHRQKLEAFVKARGLTPKGEFKIAFYDDPFTLPWKRRNEWWADIEPPSASPRPEAPAATR